jgi:hypothetical protein
MNPNLMVIGPRAVATVLALFVLVGLAGGASPGRRQDNEARLQARLEREQNPVKRAKLEIRLGRVKLLQAIDAFDKRDTPECHRLLAAYLERMRSAWATLQGSGRQAWRHPQGFKELDIALREDTRFLEDFAHRVPYHERAPMEKVAQEVEHLRSEVLRALFPSERPRKKAGGFERRVRPDSSLGGQG